MSPIKFKVKQPGAALMLALSAAYPYAALGANAGRIDFAVGDVRALAADGRSRAVAKGATFDSGETIETGEGRAQLRFTDGAQISLQPRSQFRIDDYRFSGKVDGSEKGLFSFVKGGMRTITGAIGRANRDNYKVTTDVATIGIRGTEYSVAYGNSITVTTGEGVIEICNAAGCLILNSGETAYVANGNTQPAMTDKKADLPPQAPERESLLLSSRTEEHPGALLTGLYPTPASEINAMTGTVTFSRIIEASVPTYTGSSSPGTVSSGSLTANFSAQTVSFNLATAGGSPNPSQITGTGATISGSGFSGNTLTLGFSGGTGTFSGQFLGSGASQATLSYSGNEANYGNVRGSAVFGR